MHSKQLLDLKDIILSLLWKYHGGTDYGVLDLTPRAFQKIATLMPL
jgi:hypothetical protein